LLKAARRQDIEPREAREDSERGTGLVGRLNLPDDPDQFRATLVEHLEELRTRIVRSAGIIGICWLAGWFLEPYAFGALSNLIMMNIEKVVGQDKFRIIFTNFTAPFMLKLQLSFLIGMVFATPFVVMQLWGFVRPGLRPSERRPLERVAPFSILLFAIGVGFCVSILGPCTRWFASYLSDFPNTVLYQDPKVMITFVLKMMIAFGLGFQLPLVVWGLGALNLLSAETLTKYWRHAAVAIFFLAAAFTPSNDAFSMLMMAIPMVGLFIISVWAVKLTQKKQQARQSDA
jgi:sec-independent protein translocase protein TatC